MANINQKSANKQQKSHHSLTSAAS